MRIGWVSEEDSTEIQKADSIAARAIDNPIGMDLSLFQ